MINSVIYNDEYGAFQYYDGADIVSPEIPKELVELAVISKSIKFKAHQDYKDESAFRKFLKKAYKDKSYFYFPLKEGFGVYSTAPANTKKYYSLGFVDTVVPYEYLITRFTQYKKLSGTVVFIEFQETFIRICAIYKGFSMGQVTHTTNDTFKHILSTLFSEFSSKKIEVSAILSNKADIRIKDIFGMDVVEYNTAELYEYHASFTKLNIPYFENLEAKFAEKERKDKRKGLAAVALSLAFFTATIGTSFFMNKKLMSEENALKAMKYKIVRLNKEFMARRSALITNRILKYPDLPSKIKSFLALFPKGVLLKRINIEKAPAFSYSVSGRGTAGGGINGFVETYDKLYSVLTVNGFKVSYNFTKSGKPYFTFEGIIGESK
jgi:hypothetical protein